MKVTLAAQAAAPAASRPCLTLRWQEPRRHALQWRRSAEGQQLSSGLTLHQEVDDRLNKNPCNFDPSIWGDFFLNYSSSATSSQKQAWTVQAEKLKGEVAKIITSSSTSSLLERLSLVDTLERLCVHHLFEEEINVMINQISNADVSDCNDIHTVALWFYILRKHGNMVSPDVFAKFKDEDGNFAANNPWDQLSLYNAAHYRTHGEKILDEAICFTKRCLQSTLPNLGGPLAREIKCALEMPLSRRVGIYEARYYISAYENEDTMHEMVLKLAKVNFNVLQMQYQEELEIITRWWNGIQIYSRLPFARDRIVECYLWMLGVYFEPSCSRGRIISTFVISIVTIFDDIFDSYGTSEECELFTKSVESWKPAPNEIPECMKYAWGRILDTYQSIDNMLSPEEKYRMPYLKNFLVDLVRNFNKEVQMREEGYVPKSVEEHLEVSTRTGACDLLTCTSLVGMDDMATKDSFDWVCTMPKIVRSLCIILRLVDDLESYEREQLTPHVASTVDSYMKQHSVSMEMARQMIHELKEETWKDFNGEWLKPDNTQPRKILEAIFNLTRTMEFMYNQDDNFTNCRNLKDTIHSLFVEAFTVV